jgi:hypothetical protein
MVSPQYGTDSFVSVRYCHITDSGNYQKTFDAEMRQLRIHKPNGMPYCNKLECLPLSIRSTLAFYLHSKAVAPSEWSPVGLQ